MNTNEKLVINLKSAIIGCAILVAGIALILLDLFIVESKQNLWISIGCSLIASAVVIIVNAIFLERRTKNPLDEWGIEEIFRTRAEKNIESHKLLPKTKNNIDVIAFGLKSFRDSQDKTITTLLKKGVQIRILTMNPDSDFVRQREIEEEEAEGQIAHTIQQLIEWAVSKNKLGYKGRIEVKGYNCMTLDFYWRMDNVIYVGPYWYGVGSQQTVTYKFSANHEGYELFSDYFEDLWNNKEMIQLVDPKKSK